MALQPNLRSLPVLIGLTLVPGIGLWWCLPSSPRAAEPTAEQAPAPVKVTVYDADPQHLWNRLHAALFVRLTTERGSKEFVLEHGDEEHHAEQLDPLLWHRSKYPLSGPMHKPALAVLDEFLNKGGEKLIEEPLKRALMQRDMWALFDWAVNPAWLWYREPGETTKDPFRAERRELGTRLAKAMQRLAMTTEQIKALPDNYAAAVAASDLPAAYDADRQNAGFLPPDLWQERGPWVLLGDRDRAVVARTHVAFFGGRSAFLVFLKLPKGRDATLEYLGELRGWRSGGEKGEVPQFPRGTQVALVRQMVLVDDRGEIAPTHLTESVQLRVFLRTEGGAGLARTPPSEAPVEVKLNRRDLLAGKGGGLRAVKENDTERAFLLFMGVNAGEGQERVLGSCFTCHQRAGIQSVNSYTRSFDHHPVRPDLTASSRAEEIATMIRWKQEQFSWGLLQWLREDGQKR
jgi:hypothetical protein